MSELALIPYQPELKNVWDGVVSRSKNGNFLHLRDYMDYHAHRFDDQSILVEKNGKPVAVFPCNRIQNKIISHTGLTYGGLIYGTNLRTTEVLEVFDLMIEKFRRTTIDTLIYKAIPYIFHRYPAEEDLYALFRLGAQLIRRDISTAIPMDNKIKLSDSRKNTIRKAVKHGVEIIEGNFFDAYHELLSNVLVKHESNPVHSIHEMRLLKSRFPDKIRLFGAFKDSKLLAGALIYDFGTVAHTQYLASSEDGRNLGALDLVLSHLIEHLFAQSQYFSFGISTENSGHFLNEGLIFQKEGFGGRGVVNDFYELEI